MGDLGRRGFLQGLAAMGGGVLVSGRCKPWRPRSRPPPRSWCRRSSRSPTCATAMVRLQLPGGFHVPVVPRHRDARSSLDDGTVAARAPRRHGRVPRAATATSWLVRNHEVNGPGAAFGPGTPYDPLARGGTTTVAGHRHGEVLRAFTSLNGTQMNCSGGPDAVGQLDHLRGDGQRPRRRAPTSPARSERRRCSSRTASSSRCRPAASPTGEPITAAGRFAHEAVAYDPRDGCALPDRGQLRFPLRLLPLPPAREPDAAPGGCVDGGRLQMLAVAGTPNADLEAAQAARRRATASRWVDIDDPAPDVPVHAGRSPRRRPTTPRSPTSATRAARRARRTSPGSRAPPTTTASVYFTSTQGGGAAETGPGPGRRRLRQRHRPDLGVPHRGRSVLRARLPVARPRRPRLPGQHHHQPRAARSCSARTASTTTTSAGSPPTGSCSTSP